MVCFWDSMREGCCFQDAAIAATLRMIRRVVTDPALTLGEQRTESFRLGRLAADAEHQRCSPDKWIELMVLLGTQRPDDRHHQTSRELFYRIAKHFGFLEVFAAVYGEETCEYC